jgi:ribosomal-protein-alanine N-acetyltransferase
VHDVSAVPEADPTPRLRPLTLADLGRVLDVEMRSYAFPWTRGNFIDSLVAGYHAHKLVAGDDELVGYFVAMQGAGEMHLLNLTVAPEHRGRGHARAMLDALEALARERGCASVWLEVRAGNERARRIYGVRGLREAGLRRGYYPAPGSRREDAVVMTLDLVPPAAASAEDADAAR